MRSSSSELLFIYDRFTAESLTKRAASLVTWTVVNVDLKLKFNAKEEELEMKGKGQEALGIEISVDQSILSANDPNQLASKEIGHLMKNSRKSFFTR